jgi:hypothetical protein
MQEDVLENVKNKGGCYKLKRINKIGVELEGGWNYEPPHSFQEDGSVETETDYEGETVSPPCRTKSELKDWIRKNYPDEINRTCGMHIHVSFRSEADYNRLMTKKFYTAFLENAKEWGLENKINEGSAFWHRLEGKNSFCKLLTTKDGRFKISTVKRQANAHDKGGPRYFQLNFCKNVHNTLECRLFPTFQKKKIAESAVDFFYNLVENYLSQFKFEDKPKHKPKPRRLDSKLRKIIDCKIRDGNGWLHRRRCQCSFTNDYTPIAICNCCYEFGVELTRSKDFKPFERPIARTFS